jgi:hypothetical protein
MPVQRKEKKDITIKKKDTAAGSKPVKKATGKTGKTPSTPKDK